jgi:hypothetical protein
VAAIEGAVVVGGLSALGAALYSSGIPKDSVLAYETALKADEFLILARGPVAEVERAKTILATFKPGRIDLHESASGEKATPLVA